MDTQENKEKKYPSTWHKSRMVVCEHHHANSRKLQATDRRALNQKSIFHMSTSHHDIFILILYTTRFAAYSNDNKLILDLLMCAPALSHHEPIRLYFYFNACTER